MTKYNAAREIVLRRLRQIGMPQTGWAVLAGVSPQYVSDFLRGNRRLSISLAQHCKHLGLEPRKLLIVQLDEDLEQSRAVTPQW